MSFLEEKYVGLLSGRLDRYVVKKAYPFLANFRCPLCGDSKKKKGKARAYFYTKEDKLLFQCHNCGHGTTAAKLIRHLEPQLYAEYLTELLRGKDLSKNRKPENKVKRVKTSEITPVKRDLLEGLQCVADLKTSHIAKQLVMQRKIPGKFIHKMYYTDTFYTWVNSILPDKFSTSSLQYDTPRLIIPFFDTKGKMHAFQGRSFKKDDAVRYITIIVDESIPKIYGLDEFDPSVKGYATEGPIDSMFLPNAIASGGGDIIVALEGTLKKKLVVVYDNEPRNEHTIKKIIKAIDAGYSVFIWPVGIDHKDINDLVMYGGYDLHKVKKLIDDNTYRGMKAHLVLKKWKKI